MCRALAWLIHCPHVRKHVRFDQQPVLPLALESVASHSNKDPTSFEPFAIEGEFQIAPMEGCLRGVVAFDLPKAAIHNWTVPPPYWPFGIVSSKSL
jgi:hypothetical protein